MSNELIPHQGGALVPSGNNPISRALAAGGPSMNVGAVTIEAERAIAEAQGQLTLAKRFPRSVTAAISEFMETCASPEFAAAAFYSVPNRGSGPSIRFAEEAARCYGNFQYGHRELSRMEAGPGPRDYGRSEVEVYAWDMQNNNYSKRQITVIHVVDTKHGPKKLTDQTDIDNKIANVASKQMRGRILALLPKHMVAKGQDACKLTVAGGSETPLRERLVKMTAAFGKYGVNNAHLTAYLGHSVDDTTVDDLGDLMGIYNAIKEGAKPSEYFKLEETGEGQQAPAAAAIAQATKAAQDAPATQAKPSTTAAARKGSAKKDAAEQKSKPAETDGKPAKEPPAESGDKEEQQTPADATAGGQENGGERQDEPQEGGDMF